MVGPAGPPGPPGAPGPPGPIQVRPVECLFYVGLPRIYMCMLYDWSILHEHAL